MQAGYPNPEATHIMCGLTLTKLQRCAHPTPNRRPLMLRLPICERRVTVAGVVVVVCAGKEAVAEIESALALIPSEQASSAEPAAQPSAAPTTAEAADPIKEDQAPEQQEGAEGAEDPAPAEATEQEGKEEEKPEEEKRGEEEEQECKAEGSADAGPEEAAKGEADAATTAAKKGEAAAPRPHTPWHFQGLDRCVQPAYSICLAWSLARPSLR